MLQTINGILRTMLERTVEIQETILTRTRYNKDDPKAQALGNGNG